MKLLIAALLWLVLLYTPVVQAQARCGSDCIRIGSWNIQDFGSERRQQDASAQQLAERIANEWQLDLLALQEINPTDTRYRGVHYYSEPWRALKTALQQRGYQLAIGSSGHQQRLVFAWRPPVQLEGRVHELAGADRYQPSRDCSAGGLRKPLAGYFKAGKLDFYAVNVHLKSAYGNSACAHQIRLLQSKELVRLTGELRRREPDVVLLGDFNASGNHASLAPLNSNKWRNIVAKADRASRSAQSSQGRAAAGNIIDLIWLPEAMQSDWLARSTVIYQPVDESTFRQRYSDHRPVWADFSTQRDAD